MTKADLFGITPEPRTIEGEIRPVMVAKFSRVVKWAPKVLLTKEISVPEWLQFLEDCFQQFNDPNHTIEPGFFSVEHMKSQVNLIGDGTHSFAIPKSRWKRFVEEQAERLLLQGVITLES